MDRVMVVGGAGYIGSHTCKQLALAGYEPIVFDSLITGNRRAVRWGPLVVGDISDRAALDGAIDKFRPASVIHFAAFSYVGESVADPARYYRNNVAGTLTLLDAMRDAGIGRIVFSSSCASYGAPCDMPIREDMPQHPVNPYGWTKRMAEQILADCHAAYGIAYAALRYFNACGADPEGDLGEWHDPETHLIPRILMAAAGSIPHVEIFGDDYPTPDGTCIRDYVHVSDLADAHVRALKHLEEAPGAYTLNLGTGTGWSVSELVHAAERIVGRNVRVVRRPRRPGDPAVLVADVSAAREIIGFVPRLSDQETIIRTAWPFFS